MKEARQQAKGGKGGAADPGFQTQIVGMRPAYIDELKTTKPGRSAPKAAEPAAKPNFDQAYVKRVFQYYAEDKNSDELIQAWQKATPSSKDNVKGMEWLHEIGFNDASKEDVVAETIVELVRKKVVSWDNLRDSITPFLDDIEDIKMDVPQADIFYHSLLARLLTMDAAFNQSFLKPLAADKEITRSLLMGALRRVRKIGGPEAVRKALDYKELTKMIAESRRCSTNEVVKAL